MSPLNPDVTILVPVYNEEENVVPLVVAIERVMGRLERTFELIVVDDGSSDGTGARLREQAAAAPALRVFRLRRNFGQTAALAAGFDHARGRYIVTLDGDLQNDPEDIPTILSLLDEGYDLVSGWRRERKEPFFSRRLPSRVANRMLSALTGVRIHDFGCALKGYRATFVKALPIYSEMHRYMPALAGSVGARVTEVVVRHHPRRHGSSKYGIGRTFRVLYDLMALRMLTRFAARPLHWFGIWSLPCFAIALLALPFTYIDHTTGTLVESSTIVFPTVVILLFYLGFYFILLGLLAELAVNVLRGNPRYVVRLDDAVGGRVVSDGEVTARPAVSVVIPVGDKVTELGEVLERYDQELRRRGGEVEFVVVLDGVSDEVFKAARAARPPGANVRLVRLNHPFGESIALAAGFRIASGQVLLTLPPYLQIEPADVHRVLDALEDGRDVVAGHRLRRVDPVMNRIQSVIFNAVMRFLTGVRLHDVNCPVRAIRRKVLEDVTIQGDMVRFLPIMAQRHGFRVGEAKVRHLVEHGRSGFFGIGVYVRRFLDVVNLLFLSKFTRAPLRFFGVGGFVSILLGSLLCAWLVVDFWFLGGEPLRNRFALVVGIVLIMLGAQMFAIGLVGEMMIFLQAKNLKEYRLFDEGEEVSRQERGRGRATQAPAGGQGGAGPEDRSDREVHKVEG